MPESFSRKLEASFSQSQLCVGIDPHKELLIENNYELNVAGLESFCFDLLDKVSGLVSIVKPQVSFFESYGSAGFKVLERLLTEATSRGLLVIADAKRGDIGTTMQAYADSWLSKDAPFICDALTVSPYLGVGSLSPAISAAAERGKGLFVLSATSNKEGKAIQTAHVNETTVANQIANEVAQLNKVTATAKGKFGHLGLVIGATLDRYKFGLESINHGSTELITPILAPGFGAQGALLSQARTIFGENASNVVYSISRSALRDGMSGVPSALSVDVAELAEALG